MWISFSAIVLSSLVLISCKNTLLFLSYLGKNGPLEPGDSNYVQSVPFCLAFILDTAVNNILFLLSIQGAERSRPA